MVEQMDLFLTSNTDYEEEQKQQNKERQSELTPRQWAVYRLIYNNALVLHRKTTQREIYESISGYEWNDDEKCHDHCPAIWNDIKDINLSCETDKLIISDRFEYWIGNKEETLNFLDKLWNDLSPRLARYWAYLKKVGRDGQGVLIDRKGNVIDDDSSARRWIESYGKERISND